MSPALCTSLTRSWQWVLVNNNARRHLPWRYRCGCLLCWRKTSYLDLSNVIAGKVNRRRRHAGGKTMFCHFSSPPSLRRPRCLFFPSPLLFAVLPSDPFKTHLSTRSPPSPRFEQALYLNVHSCTAGFEWWCVCVQELCVWRMICDKTVESALWCRTAGALGCPCSLVYLFIFTTAKSLHPPPLCCGLQPSLRAAADRLPASTLKEFKTSSPNTHRSLVTWWYFERDTSPFGL